MTTFVSQFASLSPGKRCPLAAGCEKRRIHNHPLQLPPAPRPLCIELPSVDLSPLDLNTSPPFTHSREEYIYPLDLSSTTTLQLLTEAQRAALCRINLCLPLHIHTPHEHIGTIFPQSNTSTSSLWNAHGHPPPSPDTPPMTLTASEVLLFLHSFVHSPLLWSTFLRLEPTTRNKVHHAFDSRMLGLGGLLQSARREAIWSNFLNGHLEAVGVGVGATPAISADRPLGLDLLFENCNVWGFDNTSFGGYDVVHLAQVPRRY